MRKTVLLLGLTFIFFTAKSQFDIEGDYKINGKLGIGTTTPFKLLDVQNSNTGAGETYIWIKKSYDAISANREAGILIGTNASDFGNTFKFAAKSTQSYFSTPTLSFEFIKPSGAGTIDLMTINSAGNIGIGTTNPSAKLEILSSGAVYHGAPSLLIQDMSYRGTMFLESVTDNATDFVFKNNNRFSWVMTTRASAENYALRFYPSINGTSWYGRPTLTLQTNGYVGIGTNSPDYPFEVEKEGQEVVFFNGKYNDTHPSRVQLGNMNWDGYMALWDGNDSKNVNISAGGTSYLNGGSVGIGTTTPGYKLDVIGTIRAQEIKVDLNGADFVFDDNYDLKSLEEVEDFVKQNKHLPEIEPAKKMEANGMELGELNTKLLQKIEELTLYMIDMNKRVNSLETENNNLKEEITQLKSVK